MTEQKNLINNFWQYVESQNTKISKRVYNWLNNDNLNAIITDNDIFWLELTCSRSTLPSYAFYYVKKWAKKNNLQYLFDKYPVK